MPNAIADVVGETVILVVSDQPPAQAEWDAYLKQLGAHLERRAGQPGRLLVFPGGGTPNSVQRLGLRTTIAGRPINTAVVSDSVVVRSIVGVFSLFVSGTKSFAASEWKAALAYVGFPVEETAALVAAIRKMSDAVGGSSATAALLKEP